MSGAFRYRLLFVGVNAVPEGPSMHAPVRDATAMSERFGSWGLDSPACNRVLVHQDATHPRILSELRRFSSQTDLDLLVLYWAGHVTTTGRKSVLATSGPEPGTCGEGIGIELLTSALGFASGVRHRVLILDACHASAASAPLAGLAHHVLDEECAAVFAAGCGDPPTRETLRRGHFTGALLEELPPGRRGAPPTIDLLQACRQGSARHATRWGDRPVVGIYGTEAPLPLPDRCELRRLRAARTSARVLAMPGVSRPTARGAGERRRA